MESKKKLIKQPLHFKTVSAYFQKDDPCLSWYIIFKD